MKILKPMAGLWQLIVIIISCRNITFQLLILFSMYIYCSETIMLYYYFSRCLFHYRNTLNTSNCLIRYDVYYSDLKWIGQSFHTCMFENSNVTDATDSNLFCMNKWELFLNFCQCKFDALVRILFCEARRRLQGYFFILITPSWIYTTRDNHLIYLFGVYTFVYL